MALALMAMPLEDCHRGTLPPETDAWRNALGLPSARAMAGVRDRSMALRGTRAVQELEHAWSAWLEELQRWFQPIDATFLADHPQWADCAGRWWHPLMEDPQAHSSAGQRRKPKAQTAASAANSEALGPRAATGQGSRGTAASAGKTGRATGGKSKGKSAKPSTEPALDYPPIRMTTGVMRRQWDEPLSSDARAQLWDAGVQALGGDEKSARSMLGVMIKEYGESVVAEAVAKLAVRASRPADPVAFLRKQVAIQAGDNPGTKAARKARATVAL
jgi:hypothetical protein